MSATTIVNGIGVPIAAEVDEKNRLHAFATTESGFRSAKKEGAAFFITTGIIELTTDQESAVLYLKSNETSLLSITSITIRAGSSVGGTATDFIRSDYTQPTTGTLLTDEAPAIIANLLAGNTNAFEGDVFVGGEGKTIGGALATDNMLQLTDNIRDEGAGFLVPKGTSLGLTITPPSGNTSMKVQIIVTLYLLDSE